MVQMTEAVTPEVTIPNETVPVPVLVELVNTSFVCMQVAHDGTITTANPAAETTFGRELWDLQVTLLMN